MRRFPELLMGVAGLVTLYELIYFRQALGCISSDRFVVDATRISFLPLGTLLPVLVLTAGACFVARYRWPDRIPGRWLLAVGITALIGTVLGELFRMARICDPAVSPAYWFRQRYGAFPSGMVFIITVSYLQPPFAAFLGTLPAFGTRIAVGLGLFGGSALGTAAAVRLPETRPATSSARGTVLRFAGVWLCVTAIVVLPLEGKNVFAAFVRKRPPELALPPIRHACEYALLLIAAGFTLWGVGLLRGETSLAPSLPDRNRRRIRGSLRSRARLLGLLAVPASVAVAGFFFSVHDEIDAIALGFPLLLAGFLLWALSMKWGPGPGRFREEWVPTGMAVSMGSGALLLLSTTVGSFVAWPANAIAWMYPGVHPSHPWTYPDLNLLHLATILAPIPAGGVVLLGSIFTAGVLWWLERTGRARRMSR